MPTSDTLDSLRAALAKDPAHLPTVRALAAAHVAQNNPAAARQTLADYRTNHPMCARGWILAAQLEWKLAHRDQALRLLHRALDHLPHSPALKEQLAQYLALTNRAPAPASQPLPVTTPDYLDRVAQSTRLLEGLINLPATEEDTPMLRAIESRLAKLLESQPLHADRHLLLAKLQLKIGDLAAATRSVHRALRANPSFTAAQRLRATCLARAGDHDQATRALQSLIAAGLHYPDLHLQVAQYHHTAGRNHEARQHCYSALRQNPHYQKAQTLLHRCAA